MFIIEQWGRRGDNQDLERRLPARISVPPRWRRSKSMFVCGSIGFAAAIFLCFTIVPASAQRLLSLRASIPMPGGNEQFNDLCLDESAQRILTARKGSGSLTIFDISSKFAQSVPLTRYGEIAIDTAMHQIYLSGIDGILTCMSYDIFKVQNEIKLPGSADAITIDTKRHLVCVGSNDGNNLWIVEPKTGKVTATITLESTPESAIYDPETDKIYVVERGHDAVYVIDAKTSKVIANWPTGKARRLRGLAIDFKGNVLFAAGHSGRMAVIDLLNGQVVRTIKIADGAGQIAYDQQTERVFCACSSGSISVFDNKSLDEIAENIDAPPDTHAIVLDQRTHDVWIAFINAGRGYLQRYVQSQ